MNQGAALARKLKVDGVVSLGGGSSIDTAKGVAALLTLNQEDISSFLRLQAVGKPMVPHLAIPTTAGTGSEVSFVATIKDRTAKKKLLLTDDHLHPNTAILDPTLTLRLPSEITAATGIDALCHAVEAICSLRSNPVTDALATQSIRLVAENLLICVEDGKNLKARGQQLLASTLAGIAFSNAFTGMGHALAHAVGAYFDVPHGTASAILLAPSLCYNLKAAAGRYTLIARAVGIQQPAGRSDLDLAQQVIEWVRSLVRQLPLPQRLREVGVPLEAIPSLAAEALTDSSILTNPVRIIDPVELEKVLKEAW